MDDERAAETSPGPATEQTGERAPEQATGRPGEQATGRAAEQHPEPVTAEDPSRRRALGLLAGGGAAVCLAAGAGIFALTRAPDGDPAPATLPPAGTPDPRAVAVVLANRARAVRERNRIAFLATVAAAPAAFQQAQARLFDNLTKLPLDGWEERPGEPQGTSGVIQVSLRYRLTGFDTGPVARTRHLAFAHRSGAWTIIGDGSSAGLADDADIADAGSLTIVRKGPALVVGDAPRLDEIARRLAAAVPAVTTVTGTSWARRAVALAPADAALAARVAGNDAGAGQDIARFAALAVVTPGPDGSPGQDRVVVSPAFGRLNDLGRRVVLTHELTHVATGGARDGRTPIWLIEGFADYVGYRNAGVPVRSAARELAAEVAAGRVPGALPTRSDFDGASGRLSQAYQEAWLACRMVADRYGETTLVRLYRAAGREPEAAALRRILGLPPDTFTADWRDYLRKELT
ncbi:hypothetical protein [Actinomadura oligospora]|uniref:hypothetical protein n=1 Tax=Actinomadura oligospora TaxID=111804 RepID=UPI0004B73EAE|nr:hypothetical protein [Actinomadura oligospora]